MYMLVVGCGVVLVVISAQMEMSTRSLRWRWRGRLWRWRLTDLSVTVARPGVSATDEVVGWYMEDAQAVIGDFDPVPDRWKMRRLPDTGEFVVRFRLCDVTYVVEGYIEPVRLSLLRQWEHEADERAAR